VHKKAKKDEKIEPWEERKIPHYKTVKGEQQLVWTDIKILPKEFRDAFTCAKEIR
jgi:hypothetical protein